MTPAQRKRALQVFLSIPHYVREAVTEIRSATDAYAWLYFKLPYLFSLADFPTRVTIEPTNSCNFGCPYCRRSVMDRPVGAMERSLFEAIIDQIAESPVCIVKIGGLGEPALYPHLPEMMLQFRQRRIRTILYTNGTLLRQYPFAEILSWRIHTLVVSIDGIDASSYERQRIGGNYAETLQALADFHRVARASADSKPMIEVRHVIMPTESKDDLEAFRRKWLKISDTVKFNFLMPLRPGKSEGARPKCRDIRREMYIRWDGRVPICGYQSAWLGDANTSSIRELWHHPVLAALRDDHSRRDLTKAPACRGCSFR